MNGKEAILNLLAVRNTAKFENWYDEIMDASLRYAIESLAEKEGLDLNEIIK